MLRLVNYDDYERIEELVRSTPEMWQDYWREGALEQAIDMSDGLAFVWEEDQEVLGFICAHDFGFRGYMSILVVADHARGLGIGTKLVDYVENQLAARGCTIVISDVWKYAEGFFRYLGYQEPEAVLLRKKLGV